MVVICVLSEGYKLSYNEHECTSTYGNVSYSFDDCNYNFDAQVNECYGLCELEDSVAGGDDHHFNYYSSNDWIPVGCSTVVIDKQCAIYDRSQENLNFFRFIAVLLVLLAFDCYISYLPKLSLKDFGGVSTPQVDAATESSPGSVPQLI